MTLTPGMLCEIKLWEEGLPQLSEADHGFVVGHKVQLEIAVRGGDASLERTGLSWMITKFAWRLAYCRYVEHCVKCRAIPEPYEEWVSSNERFSADRRTGSEARGSKESR